MLRFQEVAKHGAPLMPISTCSKTLIAGRYTIQQKLGRGSFGTVYLVSDKKAKEEEEQLKVLKEISVGDIKPNETVEANLEAQLLSRLDHPAIVKFYTSFVEGESFCIITEYCEGRDLDFNIQEYKEAGKVFPESQIVEWFIQLLLGVNYMHERRILHRDLKAKNIFLKNNLLKIGDFGVSRLLMGSCDLATTFTGTPFYMSPEALQHQGYDTKSDIWSLGCILYEMCCLDHAFTGHNFLSIVLKIVEGEAPSLPAIYPSELDTLLHSMLSKDPSQRPSAAEILRIPYVRDQLQNMKCKFTNMTLKDPALNSQEEAAHIINVVQKKVHLQTLRALSEVQKMTPRERMRLRKLSIADATAQKLKQLAEEKYQENLKRMQELRSRNFHRVNIDVLHEPDEQTAETLIKSQPVTTLNYLSIECEDQSDSDATGRLCMSDPVEREIPEDPVIAEEYYNDAFDSCSETSEEEEEEEIEVEEMVTSQTVCQTNRQDSDVEAMVRYMENILNTSCLGTGTVTRATPLGPERSGVLSGTTAATKLRSMRESAIQKLGTETFEKVYEFLQRARRQNASENEIREYLEKMVSRASDCFEVDQLLYFEDQLKASEEASV
ncbi:serine/threonine-protein kinase Nek11 isoform X1 [Zootoca vivipara]|uniref:serine/threonine-protein kinase Nek11 isoform X1 n=2 Tax=Zootoca vivipara TaxID=8524 RepID=UPI001591DFB8|nr:serine/threonine-protein kinase Nek11 isoform X1 [Zootoca vivipara]XP_034986178.1 serine/threonine-protein kinase Nek11 isoform X1 [Zootoca vivipara]XP_060136624.1 serine/threonine-protein kinase Nek11 isoform X1 [Zootoca vivipara]